MLCFWVELEVEKGKLLGKIELLTDQLKGKAGEKRSLENEYEQRLLKSKEKEKKRLRKEFEERMAQLNRQTYDMESDKSKYRVDLDTKGTAGSPLNIFTVLSKIGLVANSTV